MDPVKLNLTLSAAAQSLAGLGDKFGQSIVNGNKILSDLNPRMPTIPATTSSGSPHSVMSTPKPHRICLTRWRMP